MELSAKTKTVYGPVLKITQLSAHAQNHVSIERCRKSFTAIVLGDHDFPLIASNLGNLTAFRAIFSHIFTVHAQKRLFMNFRLKYWHHHSVPWPRFPYRVRYICVTLWPWPLTFWHWSVVIHDGSRGQPLHQVWRSYGYLFLSYEWHLP